MADHSQLTCSKCKKELSAGEYIACKNCNKKFHCDCAELPAEIRPLLKKILSSFSWSCEACKQPPNQPPPNVASEALAVMPVSSNVTTLPAVSGLNSANAVPGESNTRVKIKSATNVNNYVTVQTVPQLSQLHGCQNVISSGGECSSSHMGTHGAIPRKLSKEEIEIIQQEAITRLKLNYKIQGTKWNRGNVVDVVGFILYKNIFEFDDKGYSVMTGMEVNIRASKFNEIFLKKDWTQLQRVLLTGDRTYELQDVKDLISKLCYDWAILDEPNYLDMFDIIVVISVVTLGAETIKEAVLREMGGNEETLRQALQEKQLRFLIIIDSYEEAERKNEIWKFLLSKDVIFMKSVVILTYHNMFSLANQLQLFHAHLHLSTF